MKKLFVMTLIILCLYGIYKINYKKTIPVSGITKFNVNDYNIFYLDLSETDITTKNINKYISDDISIVSITPYINPIYKDKVGTLKYNFMSNLSVKKNINQFIKYYKDTISSYDYIDDIDYVTKDGIKIMEMEVYANGIDIVNLIYDNNNIRYKIVFNGEYDYLGV